MYSFVGRRGTTEETTAAAVAAHLGVTTYMFFFSHIRTRHFPEGSVQQHPPLCYNLIKEASYTYIRHMVLRCRYFTLL